MREEIANNEDNLDGGKMKRNRRLLAALLALLLAAGIALVFFFMPKDTMLRGGWFYDQSAEEIQEAVDHEVQDGYFNMSISTNIPVSSGGTSALANIKNIESNHYDCIVTIALGDGTELYRSGAIAPGNEVKVITLSQPLESGDHAATALFELYEKDDNHAKAGQTAAKVTLRAQ